MITSECFSGDGCGHTVLGVGSGSLASLGYPLSYPSNSVCEWEISVTTGHIILVRIADLDIDTNNCQVSYLRLYNGHGPGRMEIGEKHFWTQCAFIVVVFFLVFSHIYTSNINWENFVCKKVFSFQNLCNLWPYLHLVLPKFVVQKLPKTVKSESHYTAVLNWMKYLYCHCMKAVIIPYTIT